jgi:N-acetylgalactosamine kinase
VFKDNYIKFIWAGIQGAGIPTNIGMKWLVSGNVPVCSGLSSSSSLVVCSGFATVTAQNLHPEPKELVETLIKFERLAGTACGGMDQTISALGKVG